MRRVFLPPQILCKGTTYFWYNQIKMQKFLIKVKRDVAHATSL